MSRENCDHCVVVAHFMLGLALHQSTQRRGRECSSFWMAEATVGVKKLIRLPSGSRNSRERFPQGMVVGSFTNSLMMFFSFSYSLSTSFTRNSMITVWLSAG